MPRAACPNRRLILPALAALVAAAATGRAPAAPPWLEGLGQFRIVDASGRIAPRAPAGPSDRVALRPAYPPSPLLRARLLYLSGYAGASYGPAGPGGPVNPTAFHGGHGHWHANGSHPHH